MLVYSRRHRNLCRRRVPVADAVVGSRIGPPHVKSPRALDSSEGNTGLHDLLLPYSIVQLSRCGSVAGLRLERAAACIWRHQAIVVRYPAGGAGHCPFCSWDGTSFPNLWVSTRCISTLIITVCPVTWLQESWLSRASSASSCCSGAGTAEMARAALENIVNASETIDMHISTVAMWETLHCDIVDRVVLALSVLF